MDYEFLIGDCVKGKRTFNGEVIEGKFNGFRLYNKLNPKSIVGVIDTDERCYDVSVDSIELVENEDERIRNAIINLVKQSSEILDKGNQNRMLAWLEKQCEQKSWSEEDERKIMWLVRLISTAGFRELDNDKMPCSRGELIDWLKSLGSNHWKPSEYDISLLEEIARNIRNDVRPFCSEVSALEDLIKNIKTL